jgi:hypothetical protein
MTYKEFFRTLRRARRSGFKFTMIGNFIVHVAANTALLNPFEVVYEVLNPKAHHQPGPLLAGERIGLSPKKQRRLQKAYLARRNYSQPLRRRFLRATGLEGKD